MEKDTNSIAMLDLLIRPAFAVQNKLIVRCNQAAEQLQITPGDKISDLISAGNEEYEHLNQGCLYLTLSLSGCKFGASVTRQQDFDVFILQDAADMAELNAMALAAQELRDPLSSIMSVSEQLFPMADEHNQPLQDQLARINRGLYQMLRIIGNMSDASRYASAVTGQFEIINIPSLLDEIFQKAKVLIEQAGLTLNFKNLDEEVYCLADAQKIERCIYNILSNSIRFTPQGGSIAVKLVRKHKKLYLTISDTGEGIPGSLQATVFSRYMRQPTVEDGRFGIGLGMVLIRSTAALHGGTVLLEQPENSGLRITLSMTIRQGNPQLLHSGILRVDYSGERDHGLLELSDCLPASLYHTKEIK